MYKVTAFLHYSFQELISLLKPVGFRTMQKDGHECLVLRIDGLSFVIRSLQVRGVKPFGYHLSYDGSCDGFLALYDMYIGIMNPEVTGVQYELRKADTTQTEWITKLKGLKPVKTIDASGIFQWGSVGIVVVPDFVNLQIRSKGPKAKHLKIIECMQEIERVRDEINPSDFNLFSFLEEGVVA